MHFAELFSLCLGKVYIVVNEGDNMTEASELQRMADDLKYLNRMNYDDFCKVLFPNATANYLIPKWELFKTDKLSFIWSCSTDKIQLICDYIKGEMNE